MNLQGGLGSTCRRVLWAGLLGCVIVPSVVASESMDATIDTIAALTRSGQNAEAYALGQQRLESHAGAPRFDFAFGLAALEAGHPEQALLAFQRVIAVQPDNDRVRLELARTYFVLGEHVAAREQFERVLAHDPPPLVSDRIHQFLERISKRERALATRLTGAVSLAAGHDSNVGSAPDGTVILFLDGVSDFAIPLDLEPESDQFLELAASVDYQRPVSQRHAWFVGGGVRQRSHSDISEFDQLAVDLRLGRMSVTEQRRLRFPVQFQLLQLDGETYRNIYSVGVDRLQARSADSALATFAQVGLMTFAQDATRDAWMGVVGGRLGSRLGAFQLNSSLFGGVESAQKSEGEHHGRYYGGLRGDLIRPFGSRHRITLGLGVQQVVHAADHPVFGERRDDRLTQAALGWAFAPSPRWSVNAAIDYLDNDSSLTLFDYERTAVTLGVRHAWQ